MPKIVVQHLHMYTILRSRAREIQNKKYSKHLHKLLVMNILQINFTLLHLDPGSIGLVTNDVTTAVTSLKLVYPTELNPYD